LSTPGCLRTVGADGSVAYNKTTESSNGARKSVAPAPTQNNKPSDIASNANRPVEKPYSSRVWGNIAALITGTYEVGENLFKSTIKDSVAAGTSAVEGGIALWEGEYREGFQKGSTALAAVSSVVIGKKAEALMDLRQASKVDDVRQPGSGAENIASYEVYKDGLRAQMSRPVVSDARLSSLFDDLYRPNALVGSGSTAAAVRTELLTGTTVGGKLHSQKAENSIRSLEKWLQINPNARSGDRAAAENVIRDTQSALRGN